MKLLSHLNYVDVVAKTGSIRKAAEALHITSTALNRRILSLEEELGTQIFERLPNGVRLNVAGELLIQHIRRSMSELSRVKSQIDDLSGIRTGHVAIASGAEVIGHFLPGHIARYRKEFPRVTFEILRRSPEQALSALADFTADLALIFGPLPAGEVQIILSVELDVMASMAHSHPLASQKEIGLIDIAPYPVIMPTESSGLFSVIDAMLTRKGVVFPDPLFSESFEFMAHYCALEQAVGFQLSLGMGQPAIYHHHHLVPLRAAEAMTGRLHIVQRKGRVLSVAAAKFIEQLTMSLNKHYPDQILG
ncbi:MAG: LysR family transcriptional regulator [Candidatus Puniceispirillaceae bacterium]